MADTEGSVAVRLTVNGRRHDALVEPRMLLSDLLRDVLGLKGTHVGCEQGACGACTVLWDGRPSRSCLALAVQADGAEIETIEGVAGPGGEWHPVQQAMHLSHGLQCGFCTPGIVMSLVAAYRRGASAATAAGETLDGHICRCTGYVNIRTAINVAWTRRDGGRE